MKIRDLFNRLTRGHATPTVIYRRGDEPIDGIRGSMVSLRGVPTLSNYPAPNVIAMVGKVAEVSPEGVLLMFRNHENKVRLLEFKWPDIEVMSVCRAA